MATSIDTLADIAASEPASTRVFLRRGLDFCCGGKRTLADACERAGLDADAVLAEIDAESHRGESLVSWSDRPLAELADHIERVYHAELRASVPSLLLAAAKVERVHAAKPTVPRGLAAHLESFWAEMQSHMAKEENVLFPMIRSGARGEPVSMPVRMMEQEHDAHGEDLARIRELTNNLTPPPEACATWRALYDGLALLETELMQHIHLENNILFVRAVRGN